MRVQRSWRFFTGLPGLAFLHRLGLALHVVCTEVAQLSRRLSKAKIGVYGNESASKMHASLHIMGSETVRR